MPVKSIKTSEYSTAAVIYTRYSSHNQRDVSIDQQIAECRKFADAQDIRIVNIYADRAMTGTNDRRPQFQQMIKDAEKGAFDYVIVYTLDRFARDRYDSAVYKRQLRNCGVKVLSATENISDDPTGVLMESMLEGLAEYYSKELSRKITRGMMDNAEKHLANGSMPLGYRRGEDGRYEIVESEAAVVREIYDRFAKGDTFADIANSLNSRGIKTKYGSAWSKNSFSKIMSNERYTGVYVFGDIRAPGEIPPIITQELFDKVQYKLQTKKQPRGNPQRRRRENGVYLLTGKLFCGKCKSPMVGVSGKAGAKTPHYYYICKRRRAEKTCDKATVRRDWAELQIAKALKEYVLTDAVIDWLATKAMAYLEETKEPVELTLLNEQLGSTRAAIKNLLSAIEQGIITPSTKARLEELEDVEAQLEAKAELYKAKTSDEISRDEIVTWLISFREGNVNDKAYQELLFDTFLVAAYLYDDHLRIVFNYTGKPSEADISIASEAADAVDGEAEGTYKLCLPPPCKNPLLST